MEGYNTYYTNSLSVCSDSSIDVTGVQVLCDTPGVWYYGSSGYRDSQSCQVGDKAYLTITFDIVEENMSADIYLTLEILGGSQEVFAFRNALLCSLGTLSESSGASCPEQGSYSISTKFYFEADTSSNSHDDDAWNDRYLGDDDSDDDDSYTPSFTPLVTVGFASSKNRDDYDLGGANTDLCAGQSKNVQSDIASTVKKGMSHPIFTFLVSVALFVIVIAVLAGSTYYIWNSRLCERKVCNQACTSRKGGNFADYEMEADIFEDDNKKLALMRQNAAMLSL